jgi:hypothetical protein
LALLLTKPRALANNLPIIDDIEKAPLNGIEKAIGKEFVGTEFGV